MSQFKYIDPETAVHPLRHELEDSCIQDILRRVFEDDTTLTMDEIECAHDWLYDTIAAERQTVEGVTTLQ